MMEYDELDQYVDQLFRQDYDEPEPLYGDVLSGDLRSDRIDQIIQDAYDEVIRWHNASISEGTDPESGLIGLKHVAWGEIDEINAMMGACAPGPDSVERNGWIEAAPVDRIDRNYGLAMKVCLIALIICSLLILWQVFITYIVVPG
jgi:hypothetical protein